MKKIVIATFGTFGDIHPYLSLALELKQRGHRVVFCTSNFYRQYITSHQIEFHALRPDHGDNQLFLQQIMHPTRGAEFFLREWMGVAIRQTFEDLTEVATDADLLINHMVCVAGPIVAEKYKIPLVSCALAPIGVKSSYDPVAICITPWLTYRSWMGAGMYRLIQELGDYLVTRWLRPVIDLRKELGLPTDRNPMPFIHPTAYTTHNLMLYPAVLGGPQPDWPQNVSQTGFPRLSQPVDPAVRLRVERFFEQGRAPVTFTLGTGAVQRAGSFYETAANVIQQTDRRGLLLTGKGTRNAPTALLTDNIAAFDYLPLDYVFERSKVTVHQGGIGTCAQALHAGVPMIIVPHCHDQPDNAQRLERLGIAKVIPARQFTAQRLRRALDEIDNDPAMILRALDLKASLSQENGVVAACNCIEETLFRTESVFAA